MRRLLFAVLCLAAASAGAAPRPRPDAANVSWTTGIYSYDAAGNIVSVGPNSEGNTDTYRYDAFGRLKESTAYTPAGANGQTFTYDPYGNLTVIATGASALCIPASPATNRISGSATGCATVVSAGYDTAGNQTSVVGGASYEHDALSMMTTLRNGARLERYLYDADDQRVATVYTGTPQRWRYTLRDLDQRFVREYEDQVSGATHAWSWTRDYLYANGTALATVTASEVRLHFHPDHLGTPRLITTDDGKLLSRRTLLPFGAEAAGSDDDGQVLKFTGHERDDAGAGDTNDLDYMHARYYAPAMGRFLSMDPIMPSPSLPQVWNRYSYVHNNPVAYVDPHGLWEWPGWLRRLFGRNQCPGYCETITVRPTPASNVLSPRTPGYGHNFVYDYVVWAHRIGDPVKKKIDDLPCGWVRTCSSGRYKVYGSPVIVGLSAPSVLATEAETVQIFRAVGQRELQSIVQNGTYGSAPSMGGKYFALSQQGAETFASSSFNAGRQMTVTSTTIQRSVFNQGFVFNDAGAEAAGASIHFSEEALPTLYESMSPIKIH
ncbi:MAG TPA: RHS repeat-associated core domain-containing protein [Thermoanaerobaculia bacterium]|nr:RHS repeat-associated core domain-containing protein [Thermoanaerobaculia bacterium]